VPDNLALFKMSFFDHFLVWHYNWE